MGAQIRVLRRRIRSAKSLKKITKAQELIATSRISKAQARVEAARPYADEITRVLSELAAKTAIDHPLLTERERPRRAAVVIVSSDRGLCGGYNANVIRASEELAAKIREEGKEPVVYVIGRKALNFYRFRNRPVAQSWTGFSEQPKYSDAQEVARALVDTFRAGSQNDGVDEVHVVYTEFESMLTQNAVAHRIAPLVVEYASEPTGPHTEYSFEPDADTLFHSLMPRYLATRVYAALLESAASESASRRRAMKAATDNADELIKGLTLEANRARQAQITQEISEIVGGVDALAATGSDD
jgi:F-type H+-transporting ATPase subunit gamma